jgi:hypothetical protein
MMKRSRYNMVFGLVSTCVQVGAACSLLLGEYAVEVFDDHTDSDVGYNAAFRFLGVVAICPVVIFVLLVGETAPHLTKHQKEASWGGQGGGQAGWGALLCDRLMFADTLQAARERANRGDGSGLDTNKDDIAEDGKAVKAVQAAALSSV